MVESGVAGIGPGNVSGAKKAAKAKKPRAKPTHPPTADMVNAAIKALKERGGSSLQAVKKYIASTYKVDVEKQAPFIKKYLKSAVTSGQLVQTKGKGAAGSFRLALGKQDNASKSKAGGGGTVRKKATPKKTSTTPKKTVKSAKKVTIKKSSTTVTAKKPSVKSIGEKRKSAAVKRPAVKPPKAKTTAAPAKSKTVKSKKPSVKKTPVKAKARKPVAKKPAATASRKKK